VRKLTFIFVLLLVSLSTFAEDAPLDNTYWEKDEEKKTIDLFMKIALITYTDPRAVFLSRYVICEKDGTYFHVSRSLLDKEMVISAGNGIKLLLPYNKGQCYDPAGILKLKWPEEIL